MAIIEVLGDPVLPVYAIIAIGYLMGRWNAVSTAEARTLNRIALSLFLPLLLFGLIVKAPIREFDPSPVLVYFGVEVVMFTLGVITARKLFKLGPGESVLISFSSIFSNTVLLVLPIALLLYGSDGILPVTTVVTLDSTISFGLAIIALQAMKLGRVTPLAVLKTVARSPLLISITAGLAANFAGITLPHTLVTFIEFNGVAAPPIALFALGVVLSQTKMTGEAPVLYFASVKFLVFPFLVWAGIQLLAPASVGADRFILAAAGPAGAMAFSLALLYDVKTSRIAQVIVYTNVLTLLSLSVLA